MSERLRPHFMGRQKKIKWVNGFEVTSVGSPVKKKSPMSIISAFIQTTVYYAN